MVSNKWKELKFSNYQIIINCLLDFQKTFQWCLFTSCYFIIKAHNINNDFPNWHQSLCNITVSNPSCCTKIYRKNWTASHTDKIDPWAGVSWRKWNDAFKTDFISQCTFSEPVLNALGSSWSDLDLFYKSKNFQVVDGPSIETCLDLALSNVSKDLQKCSKISFAVEWTINWECQ